MDIGSVSTYRERRAMEGVDEGGQEAAGLSTHRRYQPTPEHDSSNVRPRNGQQIDGRSREGRRQQHDLVSDSHAEVRGALDDQQHRLRPPVRAVAGGAVANDGITNGTAIQEAVVHACDLT
eukprot:4131152-Pyramimonas_sp.AAC.1